MKEPKKVVHAVFKTAINLGAGISSTDINLSNHKYHLCSLQLITKDTLLFTNRQGISYHIPMTNVAQYRLEDAES